MKLVKSLLLGSAAGLAVVSGAQAADLPARRAAPAAAVDYVRVCSTYGASFFYIPGTETCLRVGGRVRADVLYVEPFTRADNAIQLFARGRVQLDARTATSYGLLRSFVRFEMSRTGAADTTPNLAQAFIQFGGLTAGRVTSFFANPDLPTQHMGTIRFDDSPDINLFAYTFNFGGGFSATLAVEEGQARRTNGFANASSVLGGGAIVRDPVTGDILFQNAYPLVYGGQTVPDLVGNIRMAGTWGTAQLSGALHQIRDVGAVRVNAVTGTALPLFADTEYGWAIGASLGLNLPAFGQGDAVWVSAAYSSGAPSYSGFGSNVGLGQRSAGVVDAVVNPVTGDLDKTDVWNIAGGFTHYWTPQFRSSVFGSYARVEFGGNGSIVAPAGIPNVPAGVTVGLADFNEWRIGANTFWSPVTGLNLGVEVIYAEADYRGRVLETVGGAVVNQARISSDIGAVEGRIRVQRDF